jgi:hypothetical protein
VACFKGGSGISATLTSNPLRAERKAVTGSMGGSVRSSRSWRGAGNEPLAVRDLQCPSAR